MNLIKLIPFRKKKKTETTLETPPPSVPPVAKIKPVQAATDAFARGLVATKDIIAPSSIEVDFDHLKTGGVYHRTLFVAGYPRFVSPNWLSPLINFDYSLDISMFIYPIEGRDVLDELRRKIAEMEAEITTDIQRGKIVDPGVQAKLEDAQSLQEELVKGAERFFQFGLYITITTPSLAELNQVSKEVESTLGSLLILSKKSTLQMEEGLVSTLPVCNDMLKITRNMDTTSLATTFPFVSSELTANEGILYGINEHNGSLIIFDRFSLENANSVVFAKAGAGKSYLVKLEVLRSLMFGTEALIIDPESEYKALSDSVGGEHITFGFNSPSKINPFDLSTIYEEGENELGQKILSLHSLFKVIMGKISPTEEAILDRALILTYKMKGITPDPETQKKEPPLMEDLYKALIGMEEKESQILADRIEKFVKGSFAGVFDQHSNVDIKNPFTVFSTRDLEEALRPVAMFVILDFIWNKVKGEMKKRILVVDEAWYMMKYPDSANFLYGIAKRARKYYLGLTTITQDVEDFLNSDYGKAIITNSSIQMLLKQHPAAIDKVAETFYLSEGEKHLLLSADIGEGLFFAGQNHVAAQVIASPEEHLLITSKPSEVLQMRQAKTPPTTPPIPPKPIATSPVSPPPTAPTPPPPPTAPPYSSTSTPSTPNKILFENEASPSTKARGF